jgi:hypothetical protein
VLQVAHISGYGSPVGSRTVGAEVQVLRRIVKKSKEETGIGSINATIPLLFL